MINLIFFSSETNFSNTTKSKSYHVLKHSHNCQNFLHWLIRSLLEKWNIIYIYSGQL